MKKKQITYNQLLFLYAYLRQIDLSLDRSRWTSWNELQNFFKDRIQPTQVIEYLKNNFDLNETEFSTFISIKQKTIFDKLKFSIIKKILFEEGEILYCCKLLLDFERYLNSNINSYNLEIEKLRIDIAQYYTKILSYMISKKDLDKLMKIEHYEQNRKNRKVKLIEFIPRDF